jgi:hypothetical protein
MTSAPSILSELRARGLLEQFSNEEALSQWSGLDHFVSAPWPLTRPDCVRLDRRHGECEP